MRNNSFISRLRSTYFNENLDFRAYIFNTLGFLGCVLGIISGVYSIFNYTSLWNVIANFTTSAAAVIIIRRANRTGHYKKYFLFTVIVVFLVVFPSLFFGGGGYKGSMPSYFIFAVVFTSIMLEKRRRAIIVSLEFAIYFACFITAYFYPQTVNGFNTEATLVADTIVGCLSSSIVLFITIRRHIIIYDRKQEELKAANDALDSLNRLKTEFLQDIKHEIRNPLLVVSSGTDFIRHNMETGVGAEVSLSALTVIQDEAMRLGRMIDGMVELAVISENPQNREKTDFAAIIRKCADAFRLQAEQKRNVLRVAIDADLPYVYAESVQLGRVPINLLSNAAAATDGGEITVEARADKRYITVTVCDTGTGINPEILPRVFERGVSGKGSKGYGLSICKTIVEAHGGEIRIESKPGQGTTVIFTVPVYGGQSEEALHE